jgi:hypothetical protein
MSYDESQYELMPDEIIAIKDHILSEVGGKQTEQIIMALMSALIEVMVKTAPNKESALETVVQIALSMTASINACDEANICIWNETIQ